jgi:CRP-like cAMP-binding protein
VAVSTLAAFAISQPLRRRLQSAMDRRFNRSRYDAERTVEGFATNLRDELDLERVGSELGAVVGRSLAPASVGVWLRPPGRNASR